MTGAASNAAQPTAEQAAIGIAPVAPSGCPSAIAPP